MLRLVLITLAWLAQILGFGTAATALNDPTIMQDYGQLVVGLLTFLLALAGALPSVISTVRTWWDRVRDAASAPKQGGFVRPGLLLIIAGSAIVVACAMPMTRLSPAQTIARGQDAVAEYFRHTVMLEAAGVITPQEAIKRNERAMQALDVLRDARTVLVICQQAGTPELDCLVAGDLMKQMPALIDQAEIELLKRARK